MSILILIVSLPNHLLFSTLSPQYHKGEILCLTYIMYVASDCSLLIWDDEIAEKWQPFGVPLPLCGICVCVCDVSVCVVYLESIFGKSSHKALSTTAVVEKLMRGMS